MYLLPTVDSQAKIIELHLMAFSLESKGSVHYKALGPPDAQVGVQEDHLSHRNSYQESSIWKKWEGLEKSSDSLVVFNDNRLELDHLALPLLLSAQLEMLGPLDGNLKILKMKKI